MSKMKRLLEIANDPYASNELMRLTKLAEYNNKPFFNYQGKNLDIKVAKAMVTIIQDHINHENSL
jgi:hypothetical protein